MKKVTVDEVNTTVAAEVAEEVKEAPAKKTRAKKAADTETAEKKAPAKKRTTKKAAEAAVETAAEEAPAKKPAAKKTAAKKTTAKKAEVQAAVSVQFSGKEYTTEKLVEIAKDVWQYDLGQAPEEFKKVELYVKTEESAVFYVINGEVAGSFGI